MAFITGCFLACINSCLILVTLTYWLTICTEQNISLGRILTSFVLTGIILIRSLKKGQVTVSGGIAATVIGIVLTIANYYFMAIMIVFFIIGSTATKLKSKVKQSFDPEYKISGGRNWIQVLCNGGIATQVALIYLVHHGPGEEEVLTNDTFTSKLIISLIASISCVFGDTLSSEIGSGFSKGDPVLITTFKTVPRGTNGAISTIGLIASIIAGLIVTVTYALCDLFFLQSSNRYERFILVAISSISSSFFGTLLDSFLGATLQFSGLNVKTRKISEVEGSNVTKISGSSVFDNHAVNFVSCTICAFLFPFVLIKN